MATIRLIPSAYSLNSTNLSVSNETNMYSNIDSTTYATVNHKRTSTASYYIYVKGFNFDDIPADAIINSAIVKVKAKVTRSAGSYTPALYNNTTSLGKNFSGTIGTSATTRTVDITSNWETYKGYGSNFGIRLQLNRSSKNTASSMDIYGAEILVDYTVPTYHTVSVTQSTGGTISLSQSGQVIEGTTISVNAVPEDGYELENIYVNGTILIGTSFTVDEDKTVTAVFNSLTRYTISTSITNGILLDPTEASVSLNSGEDYEITFKGNDECIFSSITINGESVTPTIKNIPAKSPTYTVDTNYGTYQYYYLSNAYDGDNSTYFWSSEAQTAGKYILITFNDFINLTSFSTYSSNSTDYPHSCNVLQVSADGSTWTDIGTFSESQTSTFSNITNANNIKYVRIYANSGVTNWLVINEITMTYEAVAFSGEYYSYTISAIDGDKNVIIIFNEPNAHYVKINGEWKKILTAYRKVNGVWEEFNYVYDDSLQLKYLGHIVSDFIGEITSENVINITDSSVPSGTYYFYYEDETSNKLTNWDVIGSTDL